MRILVEAGAGVVHLAWAAAPLYGSGETMSIDQSAAVAFALALLISIPAADLIAGWLLGEGRLGDSLAAEGSATEAEGVPVGSSPPVAEV